MEATLEILANEKIRMAVRCCSLACLIAMMGMMVEILEM